MTGVSTVPLHPLPYQPLRHASLVRSPVSSSDNSIEVRVERRFPTASDL